MLLDRNVVQQKENYFSIQRGSSLVEGGEGPYMPNCQNFLVNALDTLSVLSCTFINRTAYHLDRYEPSSPSTKELHDIAKA